MTTQAIAADVKLLTGSVQFWTRHCVASLCGTPEVLGGKQAVTGEVSLPTEPGTFNQYIVLLREQDLELRLQILWLRPRDGSSDYLVAQGQLGRYVDGVVQPVTECSQYHGSALAPFFPVGACGGFVNGVDGTSEEYGVTFYRE